MRHLLRSALFLVLAIALPLGAAAQVGQTPACAEAGEDCNCSDFDDWFSAQLFYEGEGGPAVDAHGLDADGDGIACSGLSIARRIDHGEGWWVELRVVPYRVSCATVEKPFLVEEYLTQARTAIRDTVDYQQFWGRMECLHTLGVLEQRGTEP